jgi:hypothetical protein
MALRITGSVIGEPITSSSSSATGMWTSQEVAALQKDGIWQIAPTFTLTPSAATVNEGASITVTLTTTGIPNGRVIPYVITGANVNLNDSANGILTGNFVIQNGSNTISFSANADLTLEGAETLTITAGTASANVTINDTSRGGDSQFNYTTLLLNGDSTNNAQNNTFLDSSTNNFTITRNGNSTQGTFSPYGANWSNYFDGTGDYLTAPITTNATTDLTFECWFYATGYGSLDYGTIIGAGAGAGIFQLQLYNASNPNRILGYVGSTSGVGNLSPILSQPVLNRWIHLAVVRSGSTFTMYENGVSVATATNSNSMNFATATQLGAAGSSYTFQGYISNLRLFIGTAVYTSNFTPSTTPLTAISGTSLLTCQSNRFIDNSTNNFAITPAGDVSVQRFSPFSPTSAYSPSIYGGSAYFDGTGDYISIANSAAHATLPGDFTVECWFYLNNVSGTQLIFSHRTNGYAPFLIWASTTSLLLYVSSDNSSWNIVNGDTLATVASDQWYHLAYTRTGSTFRVFINGIQVKTFSSSASFTTSNSLQVGMTTTESNSALNGYISNFRFVNGAGVYTGNFTPPTAPVAISGSASAASYTNTANVNTTFASSATSLLCNFTNAGIYDSTMINNLETVADSKISTTQSKFGGSSMFFDGTGDYLTASFNSLFNLGASNFTIEFWVNTSSTVAYATALRLGDTWTTGSWALYLNDSNGNGYPSWWSYTLNNALSTSGAAVNDGAWHHIALVRSTTTMTMYIDGTSRGTLAVSTSTVGDTTTKLWIARDSSNVRELAGYIDDLRITNGYARYTSTFTPPTRTLPGY